MGATPAMTVSGAAAEITKNAMSDVPRVPVRRPVGALGGAVFVFVCFFVFVFGEVTGMRQEAPLEDGPHYGGRA